MSVYDYEKKANNVELCGMAWYTIYVGVSIELCWRDLWEEELLYVA